MMNSVFLWESALFAHACKNHSELLLLLLYIFFSRSLTKAIGLENLQHVLDIMSMINDEQEVKVSEKILAKALDNDILAKVSL